MFKVKCEDGIIQTGTYRLENDGTLYHIDGDHETWESQYTYHLPTSRTDANGEIIFEGDELTHKGDDDGTATQEGILWDDKSLSPWDDVCLKDVMIKQPQNQWQDMATDDFFMFEGNEEIYIRQTYEYRNIKDIHSANPCVTTPVTKVTIKATS